MYYDSANQIYVTVDSAGQADSNSTNSSAAKNDSSKKTDDKQDKVKIAKKIAKDMEKWAKTLNQRKEIPKQLLQAESLPVESNESSSVEMECLLEKQIAVSSEPLIADNSTVANDPFEIIKSEEEKLTDWKRLACLLCKRQFSTCELLTKHQQLSELHKVLPSIKYLFSLKSILTCVN